MVCQQNDISDLGIFVNINCHNIEKDDITSQFHLAYKSEHLVSKSENILYCYFNRQIECVVSRNNKNEVLWKCNHTEKGYGVTFCDFIC